MSDASLWRIVWGVITYLTSLVNSLFLSHCLEKVNVTLLLWLKALTLILCRVSARNCSVNNLRGVRAERQAWDIVRRDCFFHKMVYHHNDNAYFFSIPKQIWWQICDDSLIVVKQWLCFHRWFDERSAETDCC